MPGVAAGATRRITGWRLDPQRLAAMTAAVAPGPCLGEPEQQRFLPGDPAELADQLLGDLPLGAGADPVHGRDQQVARVSVISR